VNRAQEKRIAAAELRVDAVSRRAVVEHEIPEWMRWLTCAELDEIETILRIAQIANATELDERSCHRVWAIYSAAKVRILDAPPEARDDPAARDAYVRELEWPRWVPPLFSDEYALR
jgi:hypothetical protein